VRDRFKFDFLLAIIGAVGEEVMQHDFLNLRFSLSDFPSHLLPSLISQGMTSF